MAATGPSRIVIVVLVVAVLIVGGVGFWLADRYLFPPRPAGPETVQVGDNVTVQYIGSFASGPQTGKVFDTDIYSVYQDNASYPKSLEFASTHSASPSDYNPLGVYVGSYNGQYTIGNVTFRSVVPGFWQGILGMTTNQTRDIYIPVNLAYGPLNPACEATAPLNFSVPVLTTVSTGNFSDKYPGIFATPGTTFPDPTYGWTDVVFAVNSTDVTVESLPTVGFVAHLSGWNATVTAINATSISVVNDITLQNYGSLLGHFAVGRACGGGEPTQNFLIAGVNVATGTYTENWNSEVTGQALQFRVTVLGFYAVVAS